MEKSAQETRGSIFFGTNGDLRLRDTLHESSETEDGPDEVTIIFYNSINEEYGLTISRRNASMADLEAPYEGLGLSVAEITPLTIAQVMSWSTEQILSFSERIEPDITEQ